MGINEKLKAIRTIKKVTQKELADLIGVTQATITKIETGETKNPSIDIAIKISKALDADIFELFGDEMLKSQYSKTSDKELDRLKILAFHSLDKYESNQIFLKQFDYDQEDPEDWKKFEEYRLYLSEFKKGIFEKLIEVGFCTQEDIKEYREYLYEQANKRKYTTLVIDTDFDGEGADEEEARYKKYERELIDEISRNDRKRKDQSESDKIKDQTNQEIIKNKS